MLKLVSLFCLLVVAVIVLAEEESNKFDSEFIELLDDTDFSRVGSAEWAMIVYYMSWCGHCQRLGPEYIKFAEEIEDDRLLVAAVNCEHGKEACQKEGVTGYPTLKLYRNGVEWKKYEGARNSQDLLSWVRKQMNPKVTEIHNEKEWDDFVSKNNIYHMVLAFFPKEDSEQQNLFFSLSEKNDDEYVYAWTKVEEIANRNGWKEDTLYFRRSFDPENLLEIEGTSVGTCGRFLDDNEDPLIMEVSPKLFLARGDSVIIFAVKDQWEKYRTLFEPMSLKYKNKIKFGITDQKDRLNHLTGGDEKFPSLMAFTRKMEVFKFDGEYTQDSIQEWFRKLDERKLEQYKKSAKPKASDDSDIVSVTRDSIEKVVMDSGKDVLLAVTAEHCKHCQKLKPILKKIASFYKDLNSVVIAEIDGTQNDIDDSQVELFGFPTIAFFPQNDKDDPLYYDQARTTKQLLQFIEENSSSAYKWNKSRSKIKKELIRDEL